jgi:poly(3-hydroxybutyrate) depolymerase
MRSLFLATALLVSSSSGAVAQTTETGFLNRSLTLDATEYRYQVYVPRDYSSTSRWPVILALHGGGDYGRDGLVQTNGGLASAVRRQADRYPAIIVFPQSPRDGTPGFQALGGRLALAALDRTISEFAIDPERVYLTGMSMGGNGAWYLAYHNPDRFAALVVVCGFIDEFTGMTSGVRYPAIVTPLVSDPFAAIAHRLKHVPIWLVHGDADPTVPVEVSRRMTSALRIRRPTCAIRSCQALATMRGTRPTTTPIFRIGCSSSAGAEPRRQRRQSEQRLQSPVSRPAHRQRLPVLQHGQTRILGSTFDADQSIEVDQERAMNPHEAMRIEQLLEI